MDELENRLKTLCNIFDRWLSDDNEHLLRAVHQTVDEYYFSFADVQFALKNLKQSLNEGSLKTWINQSGISDKNDVRQAKVLCLHAGNLPLVGFQDALAVLLSGGRYSGKISKRDPYLLPTFLNEVKKTAVWSDRDVQWSHRLDDFEDMRHDMILFAGSQQSVPGVKRAVNELKLLKTDGHYLIRTAHFSMAYIDEKKEQSFKKLTEAILRYGGKGCRSVAMVVAPFSLNAVKDDLKKQAKHFLEENPQHLRPNPNLYHRFAYNKAVDRPQLWLEDFLLEQNDHPQINQDFVCCWMQEDEQKTAEIAGRFGHALQSVFTTDAAVTIPNIAHQVESLSKAQRPAIYWKPDGINILKWLVENT